MEDGGVVAVDDDGDVAAGPFAADDDAQPVDDGRPRWSLTVTWCGSGRDVARGAAAAVAAGRDRRCGLPACQRGDSTDALMGSLLVVVAAERVEPGLQLGQVAGEAVETVLAAQPPLEGLLEPFDLAGGLGVIRAAGERADPGVSQAGFEQHLEAAQLAGKAQPVVRQHPGRQAPQLGGLTQNVVQACSLVASVTARDTARHPRVVIDDVEDLHQARSAITQSGRVDLPPLVRGWRFEPPPRRLGSLLRLRQHEPAAHQDPMHRRHRRHRRREPASRPRCHWIVVAP